MGNLQWYDGLRLLTVVFSVICLLCLRYRAYLFWETQEEGVRDLWWIFPTFYIILIEGNLEQIITDVPFGPRNLLGFILAFVSVIAFYKSNGKEKPK